MKQEKRYPVLILVLNVCLVALSSFDCAKESNPSEAATARDEGWKADLDYLAQELPKRHKNLFFKLSQQEWYGAFDTLKGRVSSLLDYELVLSMVKVVASVGDAHTNLFPTKLESYRIFPLSLQWFSDGLFVIGTSPAYQSVLGKKLVGIGTKSVDAVYAAVVQFIPHENEQWPKSQSPRYLISAELLEFLDVTDDLSTGRFVFEGGGSVDIASVPMTSQVNFITLLGNLGSALPLYLRNTSLNYWYTSIDSDKVIYFQYNKCAEMTGQPFATFAGGLIGYIDAHPNAKVVVDLRLNGGGNSAVLQPFIDGAKMRPFGNQQGRLFVFIGCNTFSSALLNAITFSTGTTALLVGEPTGGKPNAYGEVQSFMLPYSGVQASFSTKYFSTLPGDPPSLNPHATVQISSADYVAGRDPLLDYVRTY